MSFFLMAGIAFFAKDSNKKATKKDSKIKIIAEEKTIEDFEKSEIIKKVFSNKKLEELPKDKQSEEITIKPESGPTDIKATEINEEDIKDGELELASSRNNDLEEEIQTKETLLSKRETSLDVSPAKKTSTFEFQDGKNYQKIIANFITTKKIPNVNSEELATVIITESQVANINPVMIAVIIEKESQFNRYQENPNGRVGLMQVHPNEAMKITKKLDLPFLGNVSLFHPIYNVRLGINLLQTLKEINQNSWAEAIKKFSKTRDPQKAADYLSDILKRTRELEDGLATN